MKKHIVICNILCCLAGIVAFSVYIYSNVIANLEFEKPVFCGLVLIELLLGVRLKYLKKEKVGMEYYLTISIVFIAFILSIIKAW